MTTFSFDRAAGYYDETRALPIEVSAQVGQVAAEIAGPGASVLEIGIGTGRIAKPLLAAGLRVSGVDLSRGMMRRLVEMLPPGLPAPHLQEADARHLPLRSAAFDAVVAVHVFHLINDWRAALNETIRVLKPGGALLIGYNEPDRSSEARRIRREWKSIVNAMGVEGGGPGGSELDHVRAALIEGGATQAERIAATWESRGAVGSEIDYIEQKLWSATWHVPADILQASVCQLRTWATRQYGTLESGFAIANTFVWQTFRWNHKL